ncbi:MAG: prolyl oligopeptidase family serine peptidase [Dokdonella sp.]|uniref:alpha/beta hydrolase family protein n=1 Tax=Dokdonella sp. TaxID=2291710 RepID=UPI0025C52B19|nr:prolyl oligopeptidase family serine peptidase [Dokdonella sp.]MBZ0221539.1 prolyl oligopeptidase family serine peptidase [Dokdonella sp.]
MMRDPACSPNRNTSNAHDDKPALQSSPWISIILLLILLAPTSASTARVRPGAMPELGPDEGLLLVAVDTNLPLNSVRLAPPGRTIGSLMQNNLPAGVHMDLQVVPAGKWQWQRLRAFDRLYWDISDDTDYGFEVRAGTLNYPGHLLFRNQLLSADAGVFNHGLQAIDWMAKEHPAILAKFGMEWIGRYTDPFPAFLDRETRDKPPVTEMKLRAPPAPGELPIAVRDLWREPQIESVELNAAGDLLVQRVRDEKGWSIELVDLVAGTSITLNRSALPHASIAWSGNRVLLLGIGIVSDEAVYSVIRIGDGPPGNRGFQTLRIRRSGRLVDALPEQPDQILFASRTPRDKLFVQRVDLSNQAAIDASIAWSQKPLNPEIDGAFHWLADRKGQLRAAWARNKDQRLVLLYGQGQDFREVLDLSIRGGFNPMALTADGTHIYGTSDEGRGQRDLVEFDPANGKIVGTLFSKPGIDIDAPLLDNAGAVIGARYRMDGRMVNDYLAESDQHLSQLLARSFPGLSVSALGRSSDGMQRILRVEGSDRPGQIYHLDLAARRASLLSEERPWLAGKQWLKAQAFRVEDGVQPSLDAYLTLPAGKGPHPLVVMPHGGPVGIRDSLQFNPELQFLGSLGIAVLQVNFRGSDGYGRAFREAGQGAQGTGIEDDIDRAVAWALAKYPLDASRMCMLGASYGGYSALMSTVRAPDRYRCAVSISGVTDRLLFFTASDGGQSAAGRTQLEKFVGDPIKERDRMIQTSPVYRYRELTTPIMLVHGEADRRVDFEHMRRLVRMLDLAGRPPVGLELADEGHSLSKIENIEATWNGIAGFLRQYLLAPKAR